MGQACGCVPAATVGWSDGSSSESTHRSVETSEPEDKVMDVPVLGAFKDKPIGPEKLPDGRRAITFRAMRRGNSSDAMREKALVMEFQMLERLMAPEHKNVPGRNRIIEMIRSSLGPPASMALELVEPFGFDLFSLVEKYARANATISSPVMGHLMHQMCEALSYLQHCKVVHGDLKPENVLITRECNVKVIDFGTAATVGEQALWPRNNNIAPEVRGKRAAAGFPQDLFSMGYIITHGFKNAIDQLPPDMEKSAKALMLGSAANRMALAQLRNEEWVKHFDEVEALPELSKDHSKLPLMTGFAVHVDKFLVGGSVNTIGQLAFMKEGGAQVLFVDRRDRKKQSSEPIVRIPQFQTQIESGDWIYLGLNTKRVEEHDRYGFGNASDKARSILKEGADVKYFPVWLTFDEMPIPKHAHGYALGHSPKDEDEYYQGSHPRPKGFANLRRRFHINLAGVVQNKDGYCLVRWFMGPEYIMNEGDVGLLARFVEADGTSSPSHPEDVLKQFTDEALFKKKMQEAV